MSQKAIDILISREPLGALAEFGTAFAYIRVRLQQAISEQMS
jgi:hypothetical protein